MIVEMSSCSSKDPRLLPRVSVAIVFYKNLEQLV